MEAVAQVDYYRTQQGLRRGHDTGSCRTDAATGGASCTSRIPPGPPGLEVGVVAPDFAIPGATRYGTLKAPVRLSDYKGKTVVLAFFFKARTRG